MMNRKQVEALEKALEMVAGAEVKDEREERIAYVMRFHRVDFVCAANAVDALMKKNAEKEAVK